MRPLSLSGLAAGALCTALLAGCPDPEAAIPGTLDAGGTVVLTADGHPLYAEVLDLAMKRVPPEQLEALKAQGEYSGLVEKMALGDVLYHRAVDAKLYERPDVKMRIAIAARDAMAQAMLEDVADKAVTDAKLQEAYDARKVQYATPSAQVRIAIVPTADAATAAHAAIQAGKSLDDAVAEAGSPMPAQDLGWSPKGQLAPPIDNAVFGSDVTGVLPPIELAGRHLLVEVGERRDKTPFEDVKDALRGELEEDAIKTFTQELEGSVTIEWTPGAEGAPEAAPAEAAPAEAPAEDEAEG